MVTYLSMHVRMYVRSYISFVGILHVTACKMTLHALHISYTVTNGHVTHNVSVMYCLINAAQ